MRRLSARLPEPHTSSPSNSEARARPPARASRLDSELAAQLWDRQLEQTPYRYSRFLGQGGMGTVLLVEHRLLGRPFVLKILREALQERSDLAERMRAEWQTLGRLSHPNIVGVTDAGFSEDGRPYFVMECLDGETLHERIEARGALELGQAGRVTLGVLRGLHAAHQLGIVHRDVKPANIFLVGQTPKLLDFGVAKWLDSGSKLTATGFALGTPRYMAPEQAKGLNVDGRADLYSVAWVFFEMLTGQCPYAELKGHRELLEAQIQLKPPRLEQLRPGLPSELGDLLQIWLAKEPGHRPCSVELAIAQLAAVLGPAAAEEGLDTTAASADSLGATWCQLPKQARSSSPAEGPAPSPKLRTPVPGLPLAPPLLRPYSGRPESEPEVRRAERLGESWRRDSALRETVPLKAAGHPSSYPPKRSAWAGGLVLLASRRVRPVVWGLGGGALFLGLASLLGRPRAEEREEQSALLELPAIADGPSGRPQSGVLLKGPTGARLPSSAESGQGAADRGTDAPPAEGAILQPEAKGRSLGGSERNLAPPQQLSVPQDSEESGLPASPTVRVFSRSPQPNRWPQAPARHGSLSPSLVPEFPGSLSGVEAQRKAAATPGPVSSASPAMPVLPPLPVLPGQ